MSVFSLTRSLLLFFPLFLNSSNLFTSILVSPFFPLSISSLSRSVAQKSPFFFSSFFLPFFFFQNLLTPSRSLWAEGMSILRKTISALYYYNWMFISFHITPWCRILLNLTHAMLYRCSSSNLTEYSTRVHENGSELIDSTCNRLVSRHTVKCFST
ncbi:hypothetical protein B9Z19DRAFT_1086227 [Tuber borchii]|uniref:Uncharacterized protein n=1 Tax=Tuber borchii TaxID=42251 RepID=A0A2T6ZPT2_TUBBO|nr:hypothetical protein B9Z19DRAFT_1086227 [Tuber borchii]